MPLARIDLPRGKSVEFRKTVVEVIYQAMLDTLKVPPHDRFMVLNEHAPENLIADPTYLDIERTADCLIIQVTLNEGRTMEVKRAFYKAVADGLHEKLQHRREDVVINLVEVGKGDWSFGNGSTSYDPGPA